MKEHLQKLAGRATREELYTCIQLLALSVTQHREERGFVTFNKSMEQLRSGTGQARESGLFERGKEVLEEALEMARILAAEPAPLPESEETAGDTPPENRQQLRIKVTAPIRVLWPGDSEAVDATLENISWGGAAFHVNQLKNTDGDRLHIILPHTQGGSVSIEAKILRTWDLPDGKGHGIAARFASLSTRDEAELENILELLMQSADIEGQRKHVRLTQRLDLQFDGAEDFQATLDDISAGGMGITVPDPLQIGQSLQAVISTLDGSNTLKLRARVVHQDAVRMGNVELYHVGLKFEHPSEELNELTRSLLRKLPVT